MKLTLMILLPLLGCAPGCPRGPVRQFAFGRSPRLFERQGTVASGSIGNTSQVDRRSVPSLQSRLSAAIGTLALLASLSLASVAHGAVFTVGTPVAAGQCTHGTIQSAINAATTSTGADTIRLTRSLTYEPEANSINTSQELIIEGGYASCTQAAADGQNTVVSGAGGATEPVFRITVNSGGYVRLRRLTISGGDEDGDGRGGGIYFRGNGVLDIRDSLITANVAGNGGGIYAEGLGSDAELVIGSNVIVSNNTARNSGGGIVADQLEMSMLEPGSILLGNEALGNLLGTGLGGGLYVRAGTRSSYAYIGSGLGNLGAIRSNRAIHGGGVAIGGTGDGQVSFEEARLLLYATEPGKPGLISGNVAEVSGGGIYLASFNSEFNGNILAAAQIWYGAIEDNAAPNGAAMAVRGSDEAFTLPGQSAFATINVGAAPAGAVACPQSAHCGGIVRNIAEDRFGEPTNGATILGSELGSVHLGESPQQQATPGSGGLLIRENRGGRLFDVVDDEPCDVFLRNALVTANAYTLGLARVTCDGFLSVADATIAGNNISAGPLFVATDADVRLRNTIIWVPGVTVLSRSGGSQQVSSVISIETNSLGGSPGAVLLTPRFVDPERGDFSLRAGSPAVDYAPPITGDDRDLLGLPRDLDMPLKINTGGVRDVGAYERQGVQPLVLNADFDFSDLRLWTRFVGAWDGTQNVSGASGSGSWSYSATGLTVPRVFVGQQCIHIPGPALYRLNGRGRGGGSTIPTRDFAVLSWEFRRSGSEQCNVGAPDVSGELTVGAGVNWGTASIPAEIVVLPGDWTPTSSITITLTAVDGGTVSPRSISAWFDGIVLSVNGDPVFADGFE
jgi:hypothetical protein